jgi:hemerythrin superfamily protein
MNAIDLLTKQHRTMEEALRTVLDAPEADRRKAFDGYADVLISHVLVEERYFYPAVKAKRTEDILLESLEEHLSLKRLVSDLLKLESTDEHFEPKLHVLKEQCEHHHKEEEENLFPKVRKLLDADDLAVLGERMTTAQTELLLGDPRLLAKSQTSTAAELR